MIVAVLLYLTVGLAIALLRFASEEGQAVFALMIERGMRREAIAGVAICVVGWPFYLVLPLFPRAEEAMEKVFRREVIDGDRVAAALTPQMPAPELAISEEELRAHVAQCPHPFSYEYVVDGVVMDNLIVCTGCGSFRNPDDPNEWLAPARALFVRR
jgi:hypothetical protein